MCRTARSRGSSGSRPRHCHGCGAALPDPAGLLEGEGDTSRVARFVDADDLAAKAEALRGLVAAWIELKG